jgi:hypothetical protein
LSLGMSRNVVPCLHNVAVFDISLSGYALLNASRTTANDFDAKYEKCSRTDECSARVYMMLTTAPFFRIWHEQRPSNWGDLDAIVTAEAGRGGPVCDFIFVK